MSLASAKAKLDAQGGDPVTGYISKADHQDSYTELLADTALTGATTAASVAATGAVTAASVTASGAVQAAAASGFVVGASGPKVLSGTGSPEGVVTAGIGSVFLRTDGGVDTVAYWKTSGAGSAGWTAVDTGTGDVVGPASATDNAVARFDATTGKLVQNSGVLVDDSNNVSGVGTLGCGAITSSGTVSGTGLAGSLLSSASPVINGVAAAGTSAIPSRQDHVHASDTTKVTGPASATDNALVRFDATTGKLVQDSGITVDDSSNITSNLTVSKASPVVTLTATGGGSASELRLSSPASFYRLLTFRTGTTDRWKFGTDDATESGSNAGSDFFVFRYDDAGNRITPNPLVIYRATGKTTLGSVGATAGLELGSGGPRVMSGTGSPEAVVTAPVGSTWTDTAATTGAVQWIKATGSGSTGWVVQYGDTGWRNLTASIPGALATSNPGLLVHVRRVGLDVHYMARESSAGTATGQQNLLAALPTGFIPPTVVTSKRFAPLFRDDTGAPITTGSLYADGTSALAMSGMASGVRHYGTMTFSVTSAWPSSLPGSAA